MSTLSLEQINQRLIKINDQYQKVFNNSQYKSQQLNRKNFSLLMQTIYSFIETGSIQSKQINKELFLTLFRTYIKNFINVHILSALERSTHYEDFQEVLSQKWKNFKQFTFYYFALLQSANNHYETAYFSFMQSGIYLDLNSEKSIFPIPVVALNMFKKLIINKFQQKIEHIILNGIRSHRNQMKQKSQNLKNFIQLVWACDLAQLARIKIVLGGGIDFYKQQRNQFVKNIKSSTNRQESFSIKVLSNILKTTEAYYLQDYQFKLRLLYPIQQFKLVKEKLERQIQFSQQFLITKHQKQLYVNQVFQTLVLSDFQERLRVPGSFKNLIENYKFSSEEGFEDIKIFFNVLKNYMKRKQVIKPLQAILTQVIEEQGNLINQKINKRKEYILDMLTLKKSIDKIVDQLSNKNFRLCTGKDKSYKRILDSIESARNLADFADFTIKQCIRLKLDEQRCYEKFLDVFLILSSITSTDSFLLYHQQSIAKRVIDSLNQPKLQYQILMLKKLSERMGVMTVSTHMSMIKDIQLSQQMTQKYNNRLPFSSFKWNLKIFNPSYWPQFMNKDKITIQIPNYILHQAKAIEDLYHGQNQYKYLNWKLQKGTSLFQGRFQDNKKYRFQSQNSYMMILFLIAQEPSNKIIYGNLKHKIKVQKKEIQGKHDSLAMLLYVLIQSKLVLRKNVQDKFSPFSESEQLQINKKYYIPEGPNSKGQQVIIIRPSQQMAKNLHQSSIQKNKIMKDRQKLIEAVLVKVLKHSHATDDNSVSFSQLYKAIKQHHILGGFNFSQAVVKQRLEQLIARQYCVRDQEDRKIYHYVA